MKHRIFLIFLLLFSGRLAFAHLPPRPNNCPSVSALKSQKFTKILRSDSGYISLASGYYQTKTPWFFIMGFFRTETPFDAYKLSNQLLPRLYGHPLPRPTKDFNDWMCEYGVSGTPYVAVAFTNTKNNRNLATAIINR